ncbi:unnamed protein product, partial [Didymodactylos carnosus]
DKKFKCRLASECIIDVSNRKRCKACRLKKCESSGMRKEWILSDEEKCEKRRKIEENRKLREIHVAKQTNDCCSTTVQEEISEKICSAVNLTMDCDLVKCDETEQKFSQFDTNDWNILNQIQTAYSQSIQLLSMVGVPPYPFVYKLSDPLFVVNVPINISATRLIVYFKSIPEFITLTEDDKLTLIKYNLFALVIVKGVIGYNPVDDTYQDDRANDCLFNGKDAIQNYGYDFYYRYTNVTLSFLDNTVNDRLILKILLIIFLFSKGAAFTTCEYEPILQNTLQVFHAQNVYTDLLWRYCEQ